jgi:hypothetical protein
VPFQCAPGRARSTTPRTTPQDSKSDRISQYSRTYSGPAVKRWILQDIVIDLGFWDNRATMHFVVVDYGTQHRLIQRVTLKGERPF